MSLIWYKVSTNFDIKYGKLPNFCLCCGSVGHTMAKLYSIPKELRKANYFTVIKAPAFWKEIRRHLDFEGLLGSPDDEGSWEKAKLPNKVITVVATVVKNLSMAAAPLLPSSDGVHTASGSTEAQMLGVSQEGRLVQLCWLDPVQVLPLICLNRRSKLELLPAGWLISTPTRSAPCRCWWLLMLVLYIRVLDTLWLMLLEQKLYGDAGRGII